MFGLSLGSCYKFIISENRNGHINFFRKTFNENLNSLELIIPLIYLEKFKLSEDNRLYLKNRKNLSIHLLGSEIEKEYKIFDNLCEKLKNINYNNKIKFIIHADKYLNIPYFFLKKHLNNILIENIENIEYQFDETFNICFDTAHALKIGKDYFNKVIERKYFFKEIHLSNFYNGECHKPFFYDPKNLEYILKKIDLKNYNIILEVSFENFEEMKKEINFLRKEIFNLDKLFFDEIKGVKNEISN